MTRCLSKLFEVRHILCHEAPRKSVYEKGEVDEFLAAAVGFATAIGEVLRFEKFGLVPLTQLDMNISAGKDLEEGEGNLMQILVEIENRIRAVDSENPSSDGLLAESNWLQILKKAQESWPSYRNAHCEFATYINRGGTIRPLLWATEAERLTNLRSADLQSWLTAELDR